VVRGGANDLLNLITSCEACNLGKGTEQLAENSLIEKQRRQLEQLAEKREQLQMMFEWQQSLAQMSDETVVQLAEYWSVMVRPFQLTAAGIKDLKRYIRRHGLAAVMEAMHVAVDEYVEHDSENQPTSDSVNLAWRKVGGICSVREAEKDKPYLKKVLYIRGILRNRLSYCNEPLALQLLTSCAQAGIDLDALMAHAKSARNWSSWRSDIEEWLAGPDEDEPEPQHTAGTPAPVEALPSTATVSRVQGRFGEDNQYFEVTYEEIAGVSIQEVGQATVLSYDWDTISIAQHQVPVTLWITNHNDAALYTVDLHWFANPDGASPETVRQLLTRPYHYLSRRSDFAVTRYADHISRGGWAALSYSERTAGKNLGDDSERIRGFHETLLAEAVENSNWPPPIPLYCPSVEVVLGINELRAQRLESFEVYTHITVEHDRASGQAPTFALILTNDPYFPIVAWADTEMALDDEDPAAPDRATEWLACMKALDRHMSLLVLPPAYDEKRVRVGSLLALQPMALDEAYNAALEVFREQEAATAPILYR
jgi:hypothetical protein